MCPDTTELGRLDWVRYDRDRAVAIIDVDRRALFLRASDEDGAVEAQIWSHGNDTSLILYVRDPTEPLISLYLSDVAAALPDGAIGDTFPAVDN